MSRESYYISQIHDINLEIRNIEKRIFQLNKDLDNLYEFQTRHNQMIIKYNNQIGEHRNRLNVAVIKVKK